MEKLYNLLEELKPNVDFRKENNLIDNGILDSLDIVRIIMTISSSYDIEIPPDKIEPEYFDSAESIMRLIKESKS